MEGELVAVVSKKDSRRIRNVEKKITLVTNMTQKVAPEQLSTHYDILFELFWKSDRNWRRLYDKYGLEEDGEDFSYRLKHSTGEVFKVQKVRRAV